MKKRATNHDPLVRIGQGDYARDVMPSDLDDAGCCGGLLLIAGLYFVLGLLIGAWLW